MQRNFFDAMGRPLFIGSACVFALGAAMPALAASDLEGLKEELAQQRKVLEQ